MLYCFQGLIFDSCFVITIVNVCWKKLDIVTLSLRNYGSLKMMNIMLTADYISVIVLDIIFDELIFPHSLRQ